MQQQQNQTQSVPDDLLNLYKMNNFNDLLFGNSAPTVNNKPASNFFSNFISDDYLFDNNNKENYSLADRKFSFNNSAASSPKSASPPALSPTSPTTSTSTTTTSSSSLSRSSSVTSLLNASASFGTSFENHNSFGILGASPSSSSSVGVASSYDEPTLVTPQPEIETPTLNVAENFWWNINQLCMIHASAHQHSPQPSSFFYGQHQVGSPLRRKMSNNNNNNNNTNNSTNININGAKALPINGFKPAPVAILPQPTGMMAKFGRSPSSTAGGHNHNHLSQNQFKQQQQQQQQQQPIVIGGRSFGRVLTNGNGRAGFQMQRVY